MTLFFFLAMGSYFLLLIAWYAGWRRSSMLLDEEAKTKRFISVVISYRNEALSIPLALDAIRQLDYPAHQFEVIWVNDHSEDHSEELLMKLIGTETRFKLLALPEGIQGKKQAITLGVKQAKGEVIAITDADCQVPVRWLHRINQAFEQQHAKMVFGGVRISDNKTLFSGLQAMEFAGLVGSAASTVGLGFFSMCNGANLAFLKTVFVEVDGYTGNMQIPSGDDEFLARKILKVYPSAIQFVGFPDGVVATHPLPRLNDFMQQRIRWAGKWRHNPSLKTRLLALFVFGFQVAFLTMIGAALSGNMNEQLAAVLLGSKMVLESVYLLEVSRFLNSTWRWTLFVLLQFIYPVYVLSTVVLSQTGTYHWKGRKLFHKMS